MQDLIAKLLGGRSPTVLAGIIGVAGLALCAGSATGHAPIPPEQANTLAGVAVAVVGVVVFVAKVAFHLEPPAPPEAPK